MARSIPLRRVSLDGINGSDGVPLTLEYGPMMIQVLTAPPAPGRGVTYDEMVKLLAAKAPIDQAMAAGADKVTLTEEQWKTLDGRLDNFQFVMPHEELAEFCRSIREASEVGLGTPRPVAAD